MKKLYIVCILGLTSINGKAQTVYNVGDYNIPICSQITVDANKGFIFENKGVEYQMPLDSKITISDGEVNLPLSIKNNNWLGGFSSLQSQSVIFSPQDVKFYWKGNRIFFSDYQLSGEVLDSVKNIPTGEYSDYFGNKVDIVFLRVETGETGMWSLPSNTYCAWKETTHVGKIAAMILSYANSKSTNKELNNVVGVAKWFSSLSEYTGISGQTYTASGTVEYFDDINTAKDVILNPNNWFRSENNLSLTSPTWQYLSVGDSLKKKSVYTDDELKQYFVSYRDVSNIAKPNQSWLDDGSAFRFDSPDTTSAVIDYYYSATDPDAEFQYPELRAAEGIPGDQYVKTENNTWVGATCLYLVPVRLQSYSKYRKFDGYLHVVMLDGTKYKRHFNIDKKGVITADENWEKESEPNIKINTTYEDNGKLQYFNVSFIPRYNLSSLPYKKRKVSFKEAKAIETNLDADYRMSFLPCVDAYIPYNLSTTKPIREMHCCNFSFRPNDCKFMESDMKENGVVLSLSDKMDGTFDSNGYNTWMFTDANNRIVAYTMSYICSLLNIEWME